MADRSLKTLLVGLDGACFPILERLFDAEAIPTIEHIVSKGYSDELESQIPPWTPSAWPSLYTGVNPGKHGVYDFLKYQGYDWRVVNRSDVREHTIWELLSSKGISSVVVNVPVTHPPKPFDGALIPGYIAPEDPRCHPVGILDDVREAIGEYRLYGPQLSDGVSDVERISDCSRRIQMRGDAFRYLVDRYDPEFGFIQFQQTDTVFHEFPDDKTAIERVYGAVDRELNRILEQCDPSSIILVSDHGMGPYTGYEFRVNECLKKHGYVETIAGEGGMPSWASICRNEFLQTDDTSHSRSTYLADILSAGARIGLTSQRIYNVLRRIRLDQIALRFAPQDAIRAASERVDFAASTAYMRSRTELGIRINLRGREPNGIVSEDDYHTVRGNIIEVMEDVVTPDGTPVFESVLPREKVFDGPYLDEAPDVVLVPHDFDHYLSASLVGGEFEKIAGRWNHKLLGFVAIRAEGFDADASFETPHIFDIAPTVLATLGVHMSDRMDGAPLGLLPDENIDEYPQFEDVNEDPVEDTEEIEKRLAGLGYLE